MTAIETRYMPATDDRGSRIKAKWRESGKKTVKVPYDNSKNTFHNHQRALQALTSEGLWHSGETEHGYVWVNMKG